MAQDELARRIAALRRAGATEQDIDDFLAESNGDVATEPVANFSNVESGSASAPLVRPRGFGALGAVAQAGQNWADESAGALAALGSIMRGRGFKEAGQQYRNVQRNVEEAADDFQRKNPKTAIGLQIGSALVPAGAGLKVANTAGRLARVASSSPAIGAASGAFVGAGKGHGSERLGNAAVGGALGAAGGAVLGGAAAGVRKLAGTKPVQSATQSIRNLLPSRAGVVPAAATAAESNLDKALRVVAQKFADDGIPEDQISAAIANARNGDPELLLNLGGENVAALARVVQSIPGRGKQVVQSALDRQAPEIPELIGRGMERAIGRPIPNAPARIEELADEASAAAKPYYERISGQVLGDDELQSLLERPSLAQALQRARKNLADEGRPLPRYTQEHAPIEDEVIEAATTAARPAPVKPPKFGQSERGLWQTALTERGGLRPSETVETEGLIDDYLRRSFLSRYYNNHPRKYGATSAVTVRNEEHLRRIETVLERRDGMSIEDVMARADERMAALDIDPNGLLARGKQYPHELQSLVHARPKGARDMLPPVGDVSAPKVPTAKAPPAPKKQGASYLVDELDSAKKVLDSEIRDLETQIAQGKNPSTNADLMRAKQQARAALIDYIDRNTAGQYAEARGIAQTGIRKREAFRSGQGALRQRADNLTNDVAAATPDERALALEGAATDIQERLTSRNPTNASSVFDPKARRNLDILTESMPSARQTIRDTYSRADQLNRQARASTMRGQSTTASTTRGQTDLEDAVSPLSVEGGLQIGGRVLSGNWTGMLADMIRTANARYRRGVTADVAGDIADVLTTRMGDDVSRSDVMRLLQSAMGKEALRRASQKASRVGAGAVGGTAAGGAGQP